MQDSCLISFKYEHTNLCRAINGIANLRTRPNKRRVRGRAKEQRQQQAKTKGLNCEGWRESLCHKDSYRSGNVELLSSLFDLSLFFWFPFPYSPFCDHPCAEQRGRARGQWASLFEIYDDLIVQLI